MNKQGLAIRLGMTAFKEYVMENKERLIISITHLKCLPQILATVTPWFTPLLTSLVARPQRQTPYEDASTDEKLVRKTDARSLQFDFIHDSQPTGLGSTQKTDKKDPPPGGLTRKTQAIGAIRGFVARPNPINRSRRLCVGPLPIYQLF